MGVVEFTGVKNRQRKCCWEEEGILHKCRNLWVFLLGARLLLSWAGVRTFRHGHLQPLQPLPRTRSPFTSFSWWTLIWQYWASVGPAPPSSAPRPRRCPRCVLPSLWTLLSFSCLRTSPVSAASPPVCLHSAHAFLKYLPFTLSASDSLSVYEAILWQPPLTFFSLTQQSTNWINSISSIIYLFSFCLLVLWFCAFIIFFFFFTFLRPQDFKWTNYILSYLLWFKKLPNECV